MTKAKRPAHADDLETVLATRAGRRFIYRMVQYASELPMGPTPHDTYFLVGRQAMAKGLEQELKSTHWHAYLLMLKEQYGDGDGSESTCTSDDKG